MVVLDKNTLKANLVAKMQEFANQTEASAVDSNQQINDWAQAEADVIEAYVKPLLDAYNQFALTHTHTGVTTGAGVTGPPVPIP